MRLRNTILTGGASYIQMVSLVATQLVAIPLAFRFLDDERFGLWSFASQSLGYLLLLDFGISSSLGRLLADPIHNGNEVEWNGWFNLVLVIMLIQSALIIGLGLYLADPILRWFGIPGSLLAEARQLWLMLLILNGLMFPFRLFVGILGAQNRGYWAILAAAAGAWLGLAFFYIGLKVGLGSLAYGVSALAQMLVASGLPLVAVVRGPNRFRISLREIPWHHAREMFSFSSAVFVVGVAVQIMFMSQALIITKILGLGAVAAFSVCSRVPMLLMQFAWRSYDAFGPRWQIYWTKGLMAPLSEEFRRTLRLTMGLVLLIMTCCFAMNRWFVFIFGKEQLYVGKWFDLFFAVFVIIQTWYHCLACCFVLAKRLNVFAVVVSVDTALGIGTAIAGTMLFGLNGYIAFTALYGLVSVSIWYSTLRAPPVIGLKLTQLLKNNFLNLFLTFALLACGLILFRQFSDGNKFGLVVAEAVIAVAAVVLFFVLYKDDLSVFVRRFQRMRADRAAVRSAIPPG